MTTIKKVPGRKFLAIFSKYDTKTVVKAGVRRFQRGGSPPQAENIWDICVSCRVRKRISAVQIHVLLKSKVKQRGTKKNRDHPHVTSSRDFTEIACAAQKFSYFNRLFLSFPFDFGAVC